MKTRDALLRVWRWKVETRPVPPLLAGVGVWAVLRFMPIEAARTAETVVDIALAATVVGSAVVVTALTVFTRLRQRRRRSKT